MEKILFSLMILLSVIIFINCSKKENRIKDEKDITEIIFESGLLPGENENRFIIDSTTTLYSEPNKNSKVILYLQKMDYISEYPDSIIYRTKKIGKEKFIKSTELIGRKFGKVSFISKDAYYDSKRSDTTIYFETGYVIENLQYLCEGYGLYRIGNDIYELGQLTVFDVETLQENETELWIRINTINNQKGWLLVDDISVIQVNYYEYQFEVKTDITNEAKKILNSIGVEGYGTKVLGCSISKLSDKSIHLTAMINTDYSLALTGMGFSNERMVVVQTFEPFFKVVKKFFSTYPETNSFKMWFVKYNDVRDKYGNLMEKEKIIQLMIGLNRNTVENKINWNYVDENIKNILVYDDWTELAKMLDYIVMNQN